jgi:hypothetical protein
MREALSDNGRCFVSTPCYDPQTGAAANHVNEMTYLAFGAAIERAGFMIERVFGTFASIRDYEDRLSDAQRDIFKKLRDYYDVNYLATIFAPLFPAQSRNCLWVLSKHQIVRRFPTLPNIAKPWSSSDLQDQLLDEPCEWVLPEGLAYTIDEETGESKIHSVEELKAQGAEIIGLEEEDVDTATE